ncbi:MAG: hypothetical protein JOY68_11605 [Candidatus Dormibacteraeota bacterium]|nr:hypothetical protein [Candidatus Dormibacteraeota bacterium]
MRLRLGLAASVAALAAAGCGSSPSNSQLASVRPLSALVGIDQLPQPGFTVYSAGHAETAEQVAGGSAAVAAALSRDGLQSAASVSYSRQEEFATANGPLQVSATVERFASASGATDAFDADVATLDSSHGAVAVSTGPLGDAAHADSIVRALPDGLLAVQITLEWRDADVIAVLVLRGRDGGTTLQDALTLAAAQQDDLVGGSAPQA